MLMTTLYVCVCVKGNFKIILGFIYLFISIEDMSIVLLNPSFSLLFLFHSYFLIYLLIMDYFIVGRISENAPII